MESVAEQVRCRLEASYQQQGEVMQQFGVSQTAVTCVAHGKQIGEQIVARIGPPDRGETSEVGHQIDGRGVNRGQVAKLIYLEYPGQVPRDGPETVAVRLGDADQLADHR